MNISLDTFEDRIVWLLKQRGMSQKELAARLDVSVQFLNSLVIGRRRPNVKRLTQIATELHTSVDFLALTSDDPTPPTASWRTRRTCLAASAGAQTATGPCA